MDVAEALARGGGDDAPALAHEGDGHVGQLARHEVTDLLKKDDVEISVFGNLGISLGEPG